MLLSILLKSNHIHSSSTKHHSINNFSTNKCKHSPLSSPKKLLNKFKSKYDVEIDTSHISSILNRHKKNNKVLIGKSKSKHFLVTIESKKRKRKFPFYGTFSFKSTCDQLTRIITYDYISKQFFDIYIKCKGNINIDLKFGTFTITIEQSKYNSIKYNSYYLDKLPKSPEFLQHFRNDLFASNFKPQFDQKFPISNHIPRYWGYITVNSHHINNSHQHPKTIQIPSSKEFKYLLFQSTDFNYAFPIHDDCYANVNVEDAIVENFCYTTRFLYDLRNGILSYKSIELLTMNIGGLRVIINKDIRQLYAYAKNTLTIIDKNLNNHHQHGKDQDNNEYKNKLKAKKNDKYNKKDN